MSPTQRGITIDRMTTDPGWAAWRYKRPARWLGNFCVLALLAGIGVLLAWRG
jgi:hypothetical protein